MNIPVKVEMCYIFIMRLIIQLLHCEQHIQLTKLNTEIILTLSNILQLRDVHY
jgi:hypothetical protein